jgi:hypothetical protein
LVAVVAMVAVFVLHCAAAGAAAFAAMLGFIAACIYALHRRDAEVRRDVDRAGVGGWFGGWF